MDLSYLLAGLSWPALAVAAVGTFLAGVIRGFSGFGFALAAVPILALVLDPLVVVPCVLVLQLIVGLVSVPEIAGDAHWPTLRWLTLGAVVGTVPGLQGLAILPADVLRLLIACVLMAAVAVLWRAPRLIRPPGRWPTLGTGVVAGLLNGIAAIPGPPVIILFLASPHPVTVSRASMIAFFLCLSATGVTVAVATGLLTWRLVALAVVLYPALHLGNLVGGLGFRRASADAYRRAALVLLCAIAAMALSRAVAGLAGYV